MSLLDHKDWFDSILEDTGYRKESPEFDDINDSVFENGDNEYNKNHKRKTGKYFEYVPYNNKRAKSLIFNRINAEMNQQMLGEIAIESKTGTYAGYVTVTKNGILDEMFVEEEFRGYGIGDQFVTDAIHKYGANTVDVLEDNYIAIDLYKKYGFKEYKKYTQGINKLITMKLEDAGYTKESEDKSIIDKDHKQNGHKKLSDFKMSKTQHRNEGNSFTLTWTDDNKNVAKVTIDSIPASDGYRWFGDLEVSEKYRGYGLSDQILDLAINKYKAGALAVHKDNQIAYNLYKKHGFKIGPYNGRDESFYYMYLKRNKENIESNINEGGHMIEKNKPKKCSQCGSEEIGTFIEGEPIYKCKKCGKYLGTVPFPNNTKESPEFDSVESDEIVEEGVKDFFKKIRTKIRMKKTQEGQQIKQSDLSKYGFKDISSEIEDKIKSDFTWITSEFSKYFDKIKNNPISDKYKNIKYKDVTILFNNFNTNERIYYKLNNSIELLIDIPVFNIDITDNVEIENTNEVLIHMYNEINKIVSNIEKEYNKKTDENKLKFMRISSTDTGESEYYIYLGLRFNMSLEKIYKESVTDNFNDFELDYIFGNITESEYNRIKEENAIGQMLPQVPLNGETLSKTPDVESDVENLDNFINDADGVLKGEINNYVKEYVTDSDSSYDIYIESEISSLARTLSYKFKIPKKHAAILVKKAIFKNKCKMLAKKNTDRNDMKLVDAKKRLIDEEQEYRKMMKSMDEETKKQMEAVSKKIEDEVEDSIDDIDVSLDDNSTTNKKDNKVRKNLSIKDDDKYIKDIDEKLKSLEKEKPVKEENEDNKDFTRRLKKYEDKRYNLEMKKAKLQANFMKEYVDENPVNLYTSEPEYSLIIERQELESSLKKAQELNNLESIRKYENKLKANELRIMKESVDINEVVLLEAAPIEDEIKDIIDVLREKGYHTKYSSPGHHHLRRKEDADHNGVYNGKLYSDARLMFDDDYKSIPDAPKYWYTRLVDDKTYLDVKPITYNSNDGTPDEAFAKWKDKYMTSLREWANEIGKKPGPKEKSEKDDEVTKESPEFGDIDDNYQDFCESVFEDLNIDLALDI